MTRLTKRALNDRLLHTFKGIWIPRAIWLCDRLTPIQMLVLMQIDSLDGDFGCTAGNEHIALFFGVHKQTISEHIQNLQKLDFITCTYSRDSKRVIRCTDKFRLVTAGLAAELEDYRAFKAFQARNRDGKENTQGGKETTQGDKENTAKVNTYSNTFSNEEREDNFSNEKSLAQEVEKVKEVNTDSEPKAKLSIDKKVKTFKSNPYFEVNRAKFPALSDDQIDELLILIVDRHNSMNEHYKEISISEFIRWCSNKLADIAKEQSKATSKPSYQSSYKSPYQPSSEANAETSVDSGRYQQYTSDLVNVPGDPTGYETEAAWKEFVAKQREQGNTVCPDDLEMAVVRKKWASKDVHAEINKVTRHFQNSQTAGSSVSKNDPLDEPVDNDETTTDEFMF